MHDRSAYIQWLNYHKIEGLFNLIKVCWHYENNEDHTLLRQLAPIDAPEISSLAKDLIRITVNSVASERAYLVMNLLQTRLQNSTSIPTLDKLVFIYINSRSLNYLA